MIDERGAELFTGQPHHEITVGSASRTLALVMFPNFRQPHALVPPIQGLDREEIIKLISQPGSRKVEFDDHVVDPQTATLLQVSFDDIKTVRKAVVAHGGLYLFQPHTWETIAPWFGETAHRKPFAEYNNYRDFLRTALHTFISDPELTRNGKEDPLQNYYIESFAPIIFERLFRDSFINTDGTSRMEEELFARYQRTHR